jgi:6-phosphogluconolactonase
LAVAADLGLDKVLVYRFDAVKGTLSPNEPPSTSVQAGSGPRHFAFHPNGRNAYVINEIASTVTAFQYDAAQGVLKEVQTLSTLPKGYTGDTSTAEVQVHPSGKFLYGSNRGHDSIAAFALDDDGKLSVIGQTATEKTPRSFDVDPSGKYLFAAGESSGKLAGYRIDAKSGELTRFATQDVGKMPWWVMTVELPC